MKLTIKILQGRELEVEVPNSATVAEIKREIHNQAHHPVEHQKLLYLGKALLDDKTMDFYKIKSGVKLTLVLKKPEPFEEVILRQLKKYYPDFESQKIMNLFLTDFNDTLQSLSLDDMERLSTNLLK